MPISKGLVKNVVLAAANCLSKAIKALHYHLKFTFIILGFITVSILFIPIMLLEPRGWKNGLKSVSSTLLISRAVGVQWEVRGQENIVSNSGSVIVLNHQSCLDLFALSKLWPLIEGLCPTGKKEVYYYWPYGLYVWLIGVIFLDRANPKKAVQTLNEIGKQISEKKIKLAVFPEGTRHRGEELLPFKKGAFHVAIASQVPIQPIIVSPYTFLDAKTHTFNSGTAVIKILPPISTKGLTIEDMSPLIKTTRSLMNDTFQASLPGTVSSLHQD